MDCASTTFAHHDGRRGHCSLTMRSWNGGSNTRVPQPGLRNDAITAL